MEKPVIGIDTCISVDFKPHAWRAVVVFPGMNQGPTEFLFKIPDEVEFHSTWDHVHGDLRKLPQTAEEQVGALADLLSAHSKDAARMDSFLLDTRFSRLLAERAIALEGVEVDLPSCPILDDHFGIGGEAGHAIAHILDPELPYRTGWTPKTLEQVEEDPDETAVRAFRVDRENVTELYAEADDILGGGVTWDKVGLDAQHDIWMDDDALSKFTPVFATIGKRRVPLPAYVIGSKGERSVDARMSCKELEAMVRYETRQP